MAITQAQKNFIDKIGVLAAGDMKKTKISASLTIAQAILETGWGGSAVMMKANALFGIKATSGWKGKVFSTKTKECYDGVTFTSVTDLFRAYDSWAESVSDHSALLTGLTRYKAVVGETDYKKACKAVHAAGYATDPQYSDNLIKLIEQYNLTEWDKTTAAPPQSAPPQTARPSTGAAFKPGDKVKILASAKNYTGASPDVAIPASRKGTPYTVHQIKSDGSQVLLKELNSWVLTKDVQKA